MNENKKAILGVFILFVVIGFMAAALGNAHKIEQEKKYQSDMNRVNQNLVVLRNVVANNDGIKPLQQRIENVESQIGELQDSINQPKLMALPEPKLKESKCIRVQSLEENTFTLQCTE